MAQCFGKVKYQTESEAEKACVAMWGKDSRLQIGDLRPYHCPECLGWHVGHREYYLAKQRREAQAQAGRAEG